MGVTVEDQKCAYRVDHLRKTSAKIKFLSMEPLLGPIPELNLSGIDWVIVGGESGPGARPLNEKWVIEIKEKCQKLNILFSSNSGAERTRKRTGAFLMAACGIRCLKLSEFGGRLPACGRGLEWRPRGLCPAGDEIIS
jgi:protein gp37